jgi:3-hydroxybutyrate dehydrogenase
LINNCGVMCFGETEWQTNEIIEQQINVNLIGAINLTKEFLPLVRQHKSRIINTTSHCGLRTLPGLPVYSASKAGLIAFNDGLRIDMKKYGVEVVNFIPGSFVLASNIAANQMNFTAEMRKKLSKEQLEFYGDYFDRYSKYLEPLSGEREPIMVDPNIIETFEEALLHNPPKTRYICEPFRYTLYHALFKITPQIVTDWLLYKFISMPEYKAPIKSN